jgi:RNA polymerase sigma factor (sigma-70 family)
VDRLTDQQLLRDYSERRSETAFAELVRRHVDFVYSAALRMVRDRQLAEDVVQGVFVAFAQNARRLADRSVLSGWLHRTTQNLAANAVRSDVRRRVREQEAAAMNELLAHDSGPAWEQIAPHLDAALGELSEPDRDALLLRYFERKTAGEMAQILDTSEDAAQKRVRRAVERLREFFAKRGVTIGAGGIVVLISANAVQAAPIGLTATILASAALAGTTLTITTATNAIAMTTLQKVFVTTTLAAALGMGIFEARQVSQLRVQNQTLQRQQAALSEENGRLSRERENATNRLALLANDNIRLNQNAAELLRLRGEVTALRQRSLELAQLKTNNPGNSGGSLGRNLLAMIADEMKRDSTNSIIAEVQLLKEKLGLTAEQAQSIRDIRTRNFEAHVQQKLGESTGTMTSEDRNTLQHAFAVEENELASVFNPEQQAAYQQMKKDLASDDEKSFARSEAYEMKKSLNLSAEQQAAVRSTLANFGPADALAPDTRGQLDARIRALEPILTSEQLQAYRQQKLEVIERTEKAAAMMKALFGK